MSSRIINHLLFWIAYVCFKAFLNYSTDEPLDWTRASQLLLTQLSFLPVKVPLVYGCFFVSDKFLEGKWKLIQAISVLIAALIAGSFGIFRINLDFVLPVIWNREPGPIPFGVESMVYYCFTLLFVVGLALTLRLLRKQNELKLHKAQLEREKTETELKYLKGQINPHFLFNTLNNIYSLARKGSEHTAESVMKLAALMRFMLYEASSHEIPLKAELKIISDYIELEKLRYSDRLRVDFTTDIDDPEKPITPLLLIHFVENAFKHGASETRANVDIRISIQLKQSLLNAEISNPIGTEIVSMEPIRIGLDNIKRQLNLLYPDHTLKTIDHNGRFTVSLTIHLRS